MQIAAYVRVLTDDQNEQRQMRAIREKYSEEENSNGIDWYCGRRGPIGHDQESSNGKQCDTESAPEHDGSSSSKNSLRVPSSCD